LSRLSPSASVAPMKRKATERRRTSPGTTRSRTRAGRSRRAVVAKAIAPPGPFQHVVLLMMENRSFDHMLGSLQQVMPELVSEDEHGYKLVDYSKLPLMLLQAVKEQQTQIQQQQKLIERQQALAVRQQQQLNALKKLACRSHRRAGVCQ